MQVEVRIVVLGFDGSPVAGSTRGDVVQMVDDANANIDRAEITMGALAALATESVRAQLQTARELDDGRR